MRVICTVTGKPSHARAMLPLARALGAARHEVLVVVPPELVPIFADEPVRTVGALPPPETHSRTGPLLSASYRALLPIAEEFRPELLLRDGTEFAATLVGDKLSVPHLSVPSGGGNVFDPADILADLNERRSELGLPMTDDPYTIFRHGRLDCMPHEYTFIANPVPRTYLYRQPATVLRDEALPKWLGALDADRPLVVAAIGTALPIFKDIDPQEHDIPQARWEKQNPRALLKAMVAGLTAIDCTAVVATGGVPVEPESIGSNIRLVEHVSQPLLLQCTQLLLTHGGYNSIREAITAGVPMAVLPIFGDQPHNAEKVEELGLGARVADVDAEQVAKACVQVLSDVRVAQSVRRAQRLMLALPSVEAMVAELEHIAAQQA